MQHFKSVRVLENIKSLQDNIGSHTWARLFRKHIKQCFICS